MEGCFCEILNSDMHLSIVKVFFFNFAIVAVMYCTQAVVGICVSVCMVCAFMCSVQSISVCFVAYF